MNDWRARLRLAVDRHWMKHSAVAREAGVAPTTLSRVLNSRMNPSFETVVRITHAVGETVGWLLEEQGYDLSNHDRENLRRAVEMARHIIQEYERK